MIIKKGMTFDTLAEKGCVALADSDDEGRFLARDSSDVECEFTTAMVVCAREPEYLVAARLVIDGAELGVLTHEVSVAFHLALEAVKKLDPQPSEMFAVWEVGDVEPSQEAAESHTACALPQYVYTYAGGRLWLLDEMYVGVTKSDCRG